MKNGVNNLKSQKGFTLVELIVVIAILAVLAGVAVPNYLTYKHTSRINSDIAISDEIIRLIRVSEIEAGNKFTSNSQVQSAFNKLNFSSSSSGSGSSGGLSLMSSSTSASDGYTATISADGKIEVSFKASSKLAGKYNGTYTVKENEGVISGNSAFMARYNK